MAIGYAYSILGDYHLAEDAAQVREGRLSTTTEMGTELKPGAWRDAEERAGLKGSGAGH